MGIQQFWFNYNQTPTVLPNVLISAWYNALSVKPSNNLTTALNNLSQGLFDDGNWQKTALLGLVAGMETEEQQLKPLISTSGDDFVKIGFPTMDNNGINPNGGGGYLDLKWNPTDDGAGLYTLNNAFMSSYYGNDDVLFVQGAMGSSEAVAGNTGSIQRNGTVLDAYMNYDINSGEAVPSINNGVTNFYAAAVITGGNITVRKNATTNTIPAGTVLLPTLDFYGGEINLDGSAGGYAGNSYLRHFMAGDGTANQAQILARLDAFYTARGL